MQEYPEQTKKIESENSGPPRALVVAVQTQDQSDREAEVSRSELDSLAATLGIEVVGEVVQKRSKASKSTYLGSGKIDELVDRVEAVGATMVLVDDELTARQLRSLEMALAAEVLDRAAVILRIFELRARTREARMEVEIARLEYELPRVRDDSSKDDRQGGGGRGERGHTNTELEKQRIRDRLASLRQELREVQSREEAWRGQRAGVFQVALVGYTNAGKSSLMRGLTGSEVLVEDKLFATLGTTVRQLQPPVTPPILLSDTVGFIKNLPHELVASFKSTLEEARLADLVAHVVDISDADWRDQLRVTRETLRSIDADGVPTRLVFNKVDGLEAAAREKLAEEFPEAIQVSAFNASDLQELRARFVESRDLSLSQENFLIPFEQGKLLGEMHEQAHVVDEAHSPEGTILRIRARPYLLDRWRGQLDEEPAVESVDDALEAAARYDLNLIATEANFEETGLDYRVLFAEDDEDERWVLRIPRREELLVASRREGRILRMIGEKLEVEVPRWRLHTPRVIAYRQLRGRPAWSYTKEGELQWNGLDPAALAPAFIDSTARFIATLQKVSKEEVESVGAAVSTIDELREKRRVMMEEMLDVLTPDAAVVARWRRWLEDEENWPDFTTLIHGDLHPGHMLLNEDSQVVGVLDWSEAAIDDPAQDLSMFYGCFGPQVLEQMLERLRAAGGRVWPGAAAHIEELWAFYPVVIADWATRAGHKGALEHARIHLDAVEGVV